MAGSSQEDPGGKATWAVVRNSLGGDASQKRSWGVAARQQDGPRMAWALLPMVAPIGRPELA